MMVSIITGAPFWVWPVLALLVWFGLKATKERVVPTWLIYVTPLAGVLSLNAVYGLGAGLGVWLVFGVAYLLGAHLGRKYQADIVLSKEGGQATLAGEWLTFVVLMVVFWMNFAGGVALAISPEAYASAGFQIAFVIVAGLAAGSFLGRAIGTYQT